MKHMRIMFLMSILLALSGCGHSTLTERESTGVAVFVPFCDGTIGVCVGNMKTTTANMRGSASMETTSTASGGLFSGAGGVSKITNFKTNAQLNEGNLVKVMTSPEVPDAAKIILATNLASAVKAPKFMPSIMQTEASTIHLGSEAIQSNTVERIERRSSGIDKIIETVPQITTPIVTEVTDVVNDTTGKIIESADHITDRTFDWAITTKWLGIISAICLVILAYFKNKKKDESNNKSPVMESINPNLKHTTSFKRNRMSAAPSGGMDDFEPVDAEATIKQNDAVLQEEEEKAKKGFWAKFLSILGMIFGLVAKMPDSWKKKVAHTTVDWMKEQKQRKDEKAKAKTEQTNV